MESNDYRLERWLAVLLALLFFLPFVARADEVASATAAKSGQLVRRAAQISMTGC